MEMSWFSGVFDLPWWGVVTAALVLTHVTIVSVTVFLHRHQAHHALALFGQTYQQVVDRFLRQRPDEIVAFPETLNRIHALPV